MLLAASNSSRRLLYLSYIGEVRAGDLARTEEEVKTLAAGLPRGFRLLVDLSQLEVMEMGCMTVIGRMMELFDQYGVEMIVRVIPDPAKDIGFNIFTLFHYPHRPKVVTCQNMAEAGRALEF